MIYEILAVILWIAAVYYIWRSIHPWEEETDEHRTW